MHYTSQTLLVALAALHAHALPAVPMAETSIAKRQAGPIGVLPEILMIAIVDGGGPAVEAFGFGGQIAKALFGELDPGEPYKDTENCRMNVHSDDVSLPPPPRNPT